MGFLHKLVKSGTLAVSGGQFRGLGVTKVISMGFSSFSQKWSPLENSEVNLSRNTSQGVTKVISMGLC